MHLHIAHETVKLHSAAFFKSPNSPYLHPIDCYMDNHSAHIKCSIKDLNSLWQWNQRTCYINAVMGSEKGLWDVPKYCVRTKDAHFKHTVWTVWTVGYMACSLWLSCSNILQFIVKIYKKCRHLLHNFCQVVWKRNNGYVTKFSPNTYADYFWL